MKQEQEIQNLLNFMKGNFSLKYNTILFRILFFSKCYHYGVLGSDVIQSGGLVRVDIQGVSIPMSQTSPVYSPPQNKQKSSYQYGSKNEQFPRYPVLCRNPRNASKTAELPFHIRFYRQWLAIRRCSLFTLELFQGGCSLTDGGDRNIEHAESRQGSQF